MSPSPRIPMQVLDPTSLLIVFALALVVSYGAIALLQPLWRNYALARPNARSSHKNPTPQGGGIAVLLGIAVALLFTPVSAQIYGLYAAAVALGALGAFDDLHTIGAAPRLLVQVGAAIAVVVLLPASFHAVPMLPMWIERALLVLGLVWFVNLTNFMDGIDWISVAEIAPLAAALALFGLAGALPIDAALLAAALCGALLGFAPFNRPVAKLFLGDVGSLPVGLIAGWLLIRLGEHHLAAALLLPLYYIADTTITLARRFARGESVMEAHRHHFYQQAVDGRLSVSGVVARVFVLNIVLIALAALCIKAASPPLHIAAVAAGCTAVGATLIHFARQTKRG